MKKRNIKEKNRKCTLPQTIRHVLTHISRQPLLGYHLLHRGTWDLLHVRHPIPCSEICRGLSAPLLFRIPCANKHLSRLSGVSVIVCLQVTAVDISSFVRLTQRKAHKRSYNHFARFLCGPWRRICPCKECLSTYFE